MGHSRPAELSKIGEIEGSSSDLKGRAKLQKQSWKIDESHSSSIRIIHIHCTVGDSWSAEWPKQWDSGSDLNICFVLLDFDFDFDLTIRNIITKRTLILRRADLSLSESGGGDLNIGREGKSKQSSWSKTERESRQNKRSKHYYIPAFKWFW